MDAHGVAGPSGSGPFSAASLQWLLYLCEGSSYHVTAFPDDSPQGKKNGFLEKLLRNEVSVLLRNEVSVLLQAGATSVLLPAGAASVLLRNEERQPSSDSHPATAMQRQPC